MLGSPVRPLQAQEPAPAVGLGFGVDTTAPDVGPIVRLVRAYLARPDSTAVARGLWTSAAASDRLARDLAARYAYQGFPATVAGIVATGPGDSVYVVKLLHARAERAGGTIAPLAMQRLYAVRAPNAPYGWQLAGALPRLTRDWPTYAAGRITFHYGPGQRPDVERAARAARFVDSVAALLAAAPPAQLDAYVTASPDAYFRALGLDFFVRPSGRSDATGENTLPDVGVVLAGAPAEGEAYRHELVHAAAANAAVRGWVQSEGLAAWLGGSRGRTPGQLYQALVAYQAAHPAVTFEALVRGEVSVEREAAATSDARYASGALAYDAVSRRSGVVGVRALAAASDDASALRTTLARLVGVPASADALDRWWRVAARAAAGRSATAAPGPPAPATAARGRETGTTSGLFNSGPTVYAVTLYGVVTWPAGARAADSVVVLPDTDDCQAHGIFHSAGAAVAADGAFGMTLPFGSDRPCVRVAAVHAGRRGAPTEARPGPLAPRYFRSPPVPPDSLHIRVDAPPT